MNKKSEEKPLRMVAPDLYSQMEEVLRSHHIHPYDIHTTAVERDGGLDLFLRFGEFFSQSASIHVDFETAKGKNEEMMQFFQEVVERCKKQLITDYFKMIKL